MPTKNIKTRNVETTWVIVTQWYLMTTICLFADLSHLEEKAAFGSSWGTRCVLDQMDGEGLKCKGHKYVNMKNEFND